MGEEGASQFLTSHNESERDKDRESPGGYVYSVVTLNLLSATHSRSLKGSNGCGTYLPVIPPSRVPYSLQSFQKSGKWYSQTEHLRRKPWQLLRHPLPVP